MSLSAAPVAEPQLELFARICSAVRTSPHDEVTYGESALRLASTLSLGLESPVFYFAGDDERIDMGAVVFDGRITELSTRFGAYRVMLSGGEFVVEPRRFEEDPEFGPRPDVIASLRKIHGVRVTDPIVVADPPTLYGSAVAMWPREVGDPAEMLGLGTWDPFHNVESDYRKLFERACPVAELPRRRTVEPQPWTQRDLEALRPARTVFQYGVYAFGALVVAFILFVLGAFLHEILR